MKILLELNGWFKEEDIPRYELASGRVRATLYPPMNILVADKLDIPKQNISSIMFTYLGKQKDGLPVFQYET